MKTSVNTPLGGGTIECFLIVGPKGYRNVPERPDEIPADSFLRVGVRMNRPIRGRLYFRPSEVNPAPAPAKR